MLLPDYPPPPHHSIHFSFSSNSTLLFLIFLHQTFLCFRLTIISQNISYYKTCNLCKKMECVLQQGCFRDRGLNPVHQNGDVSASVSDDSFVDQLLNLSAENTLDDVDDHHSTASLLSPLPPPLQPPSAVAEEDDDFDSLLALPEEEADLEWLSHFVEDSFSQFYHASGIAHTMPEKIRPPAVLPKSRRSKRLRPSAVRSWTLASPPISSSLTESTTSSSPSSSATSSPYWPTSPSTPLAFPDPSNSKKKAARSMPGGSSSAASRRCSHCGTQKTPQWRAGPMGSKTLCNACGVRFKTGRLLPEYRPACSPTFSSVLHSNSHRKVLEMRRNKESTDPTEPGL